MVTSNDRSEVYLLAVSEFLLSFYLDLPLDIIGAVYHQLVLSALNSILYQVIAFFKGFTILLLSKSISIIGVMLLCFCHRFFMFFKSIRQNLFEEDERKKAIVSYHLSGLTAIAALPWRYSVAQTRLVLTCSYTSALRYTRKHAFYALMATS